jgi:hypothetical protein
MLVLYFRILNVKLRCIGASLLSFVEIFEMLVNVGYVLTKGLRLKFGKKLHNTKH